MTKVLLMILVLLQFYIVGNTQEKVSLYFNSDWEVTKKYKSVFHREAEYDLNEFKLNGKVFDYDSLNVLLMEGNYLNGKRNGEFVFYYKNGKVKSKGKYLNTYRIGKWEYYYSDGHVKQILFFSERDQNRNSLSIGEFYDKDGNQKIKNGTGKWINDSI
jgi:antitoxin component YwqK of YwqJK toxin-antitoxin module